MKWCVFRLHTGVPVRTFGNKLDRREVASHQAVSRCHPIFFSNEGILTPFLARVVVIIQESEFTETGNTILGRLNDMNKRMDDLDSST